MEERIETEREKGERENENMPQVGIMLNPPPALVPEISIER